MVWYAQHCGHSVANRLCNADIPGLNTTTDNVEFLLLLPYIPVTKVGNMIVLLSGHIPFHLAFLQSVHSLRFTVIICITHVTRQEANNGTFDLYLKYCHEIRFFMLVELYSISH